MAYQDIATINISLQGAGVTAQGFGTPLFASSHRYFPERVRAYTSVTAAAEDLPTSSAAYKAVQGYFSNSPAPSIVKIGRREADLDLTVASGATSASLTVFANDGTNTYSVAVNITGQVDQDAVATAIAAAIEGDPDVGPLVVASAATNVVSIDVASATYTFWVKSLSSNLSETYNTTETAPDLINAISSEDDDYYFFSADDHTEAFVLAAAADIEARTKLYFVSSAQQTTLTAYVAGSATDILGKLRDGAYDRTKALFHHNADTEFPECEFVGFNASKVAGRARWTVLPVSISASQDPSTGKALSVTQRGYLEDRNVAYVEVQSGQVNVLRSRLTSAGNFTVESIRGRDSMAVDMDVAYTNLFLGTSGYNDVPYNDTGVNKLDGVCKNVLDTYVGRTFINANYQTNFPSYREATTSDIANGIYRLGTFKAELTNSIDSVVINGSLVLQLN